MATRTGYWMFIHLLATFLVLFQSLSPVLDTNVRPLAVYWEKFYDSTGGYLFVDELLEKFELFFLRQSLSVFIECLVIVRIHWPPL
jgi:hypothetical protein